MNIKVVQVLEDLEFLHNDYEKAEYLQNLIVTSSTGGMASDSDYSILRAYFLESAEYEALLPDFVRTKRDLRQFWSFIKPKFSTYAERREFIWESFNPLLSYLESGTKNAVSKGISENKFSKYGVSTIHRDIHKALVRVKNDPEGAITLSRTILETVCKFIADKEGIHYSDTTELSVLYKSVAKDLKLSSDQHSEEVFRQILGGCSAVVNGLGTLRNRLGDAHGKSSKIIRPAARHAELAVNLAGSMAVFLLETYEVRNQ